MFRRSRGLLASLACLGALAVNASAVPVFDFEEQPTTAHARFGAPPSTGFTSLSMEKDGLTMTLARPDGQAFGIVSDLTSQADRPATWGERSLDPSFSGNPAEALICTFSVPINSASIEFGDYGCSRDTFFVEAFDAPDGTGNRIAHNSVSYGASGQPTFGTGNVTADGIRSLRFSGGTSGYPHSIFYDNIRVDCVGNAIPEAGSITLLAGALPLLGLLRRRTR